MAALVCLLFPQVARVRKVGFEHSSPSRVHELALTQCSEAETYDVAHHLIAECGS